MRLSILFVFFLMAIVGCNKKETTCGDRRCKVIPLFLHLSANYTVADIDTVRVLTYPADGTFTGGFIEDVFSFDSSELNTSSQPYYWRTKMELTQGHDYRVIIPATGQTFDVTKVTSPDSIDENYCGGSRGECRSFTKACTVSGGSFSIDAYWGDLNGPYAVRLIK